MRTKAVLESEEGLEHEFLIVGLSPRQADNVPLVLDMETPTAVARLRLTCQVGTGKRAQSWVLSRSVSKYSDLPGRT